MGKSVRPVYSVIVSVKNYFLVMSQFSSVLLSKRDMMKDNDIGDFGLEQCHFNNHWFSKKCYTKIYVSGLSTKEQVNQEL